MAPSKPVLLLIHGAYHRPSHFDRLTDVLQKHDYEVQVPPLPSVGVSKDPGNAVSKDTSAILATLRSITSKGRDVLVFMHSLGGCLTYGVLIQVGSEGIAAFLSERESDTVGSAGHGQIIALVYLSAYILNRNENFIQEHTVAKDPRAAEFPTTISEETMTVVHSKPREWFYSPTTRPADADAAIAMLQQMAVSAFMEPMKYGGYGWGEFGVPVTYIACKQDVAIPASMQEDYIRRLQDAGVQVKAVWLDYDHSPFLSYPEEIASIITSAT